MCRPYEAMGDVARALTLVKTNLINGELPYELAMAVPFSLTG